MANRLIEERDRFDIEMPEQRRTVNGREWGMVRAGINGPALVLLPGTLGRGDIFWQQMDALMDRVQILALSYPASGSIEKWADDISTLMELAGLESATLSGSSLGGYMAHYFTATYPEKVDNLIAANTLHSVTMLSGLPPYSLDLDTTPIEELKHGFQSAMQRTVEEQPERRELVELLMGEVSGRINDTELRMRLKALKFAPELPGLSLSADRIFTIESGDDQLIPPPVRDAVRALLKPKKSYVFKNGSHFPYVVDPEGYNVLLEEILGLEVTGQAWPAGQMSER